jgi:hypothetical protein
VFVKNICKFLFYCDTMDPVNPTIDVVVSLASLEKLFDTTARKPESHIYSCQKVCSLVNFKIQNSKEVRLASEAFENYISLEDATGLPQCDDFHILLEKKISTDLNVIYCAVLLNEFVSSYDILHINPSEENTIDSLNPDEARTGIYISDIGAKIEWLRNPETMSGYAMPIPFTVSAIRAPYSGTLFSLSGSKFNFDKSSYILKHGVNDFTAIDSDVFHKTYSIVPEPCLVTILINGKSGKFLANGVLSPLEVHEQLATQIGLCSKTWDFFAGGNVLRKFLVKPTRTTGEMLRRFNCLNVVEYFDDDYNSDCDNSIDSDPLDLGNPMIIKRPRTRSLSDDQNHSDDQTHRDKNSPLSAVVLNSFIMGRNATKTFKKIKNPFKKRRVENIKWAPRHQLDSPNEDLEYDFICKTQFYIGQNVCRTPGVSVKRKNNGFKLHCKICNSRVKRGRFFA